MSQRRKQTYRQQKPKGWSKIRVLQTAVEIGQIIYVGPRMKVVFKLAKML